VRFELTILGCSSALPTAKRYPTAQVLNVLERFFLIDCGEGTQIQMRKNRIANEKINHIFISHLHGDHLFGLIGLISTFSLQGRKYPLHIYAHSKLEPYLRNQIEILGSPLSYELVFHVISGNMPQLLFEDKSVEVSAFPLRHGAVPCAGFLFREKERPRSLRKDMLDVFEVPIKDRQSIKDGADFIHEDGRIIENRRLTIAPARARSYAFCTDKNNSNNFKCRLTLS